MKALKNQLNEGGPPIILEIPLPLIDTEDQSVREAQDDDHVVELAMSITKHGLLQPIVVEKKKDGRYQLQAGFHRLVAFHRLRRKTIPAHIRAEKTGPVKAIALVENICRKNMSLDEEVKAIAHLHLEENLSISSICDLTGKSTGWVQKRLMIPNLPEEVKKELLAGTISISHAETIGSVQQENIRNILLNQVISAKLTQRQTQELAALYLDTPTIQASIEAGLEKAKEIQNTQPYPTRTCDICQTKHPLNLINFLAICHECESWVSNTLASNPKKEEKNGG